MMNEKFEYVCDDGAVEEVIDTGNGEEVDIWDSMGNVCTICYVDIPKLINALKSAYDYHIKETYEQ